MAEAKKKQLYIVYEYTSKVGGLEGNRYMTVYDEQEFNEEFDSGRLTTTRDGRERVVPGGRGIRLQEAQTLCSQVPMRKQLRGAIQLATKDDGSVNPSSLDMELKNLEFALAKERKIDLAPNLTSSN